MAMVAAVTVMRDADMPVAELAVVTLAAQRVVMPVVARRADIAAVVPHAAAGAVAASMVEAAVATVVAADTGNSGLLQTEARPASAGGLFV
jgi:hypothetical protein